MESDFSTAVPVAAKGRNTGGHLAVSGRLTILCSVKTEAPGQGAELCPILRLKHGREKLLLCVRLSAKGSNIHTGCPPLPYMK